MTNDPFPFKRESLPDLSFPEYLDQARRTFSEYAFSSMVKQGKKNLSGSFDLVDLPEDYTALYHLLYWIAQTNGIVSSLNMVLADMDELSSDPTRYPGKAYTRMILLMNTYFFEFFLLREKLNRFLRKANKASLVCKSETHQLKNTFQEIFRDIIAVRNKIVHETISWPGEEHMVMLLATMLDDEGLYTRHKTTGETLTVQGALRGFCSVWIPLLNIEARKAIAVLQEYVRIFSELISKQLTERKAERT